jgi:hypothetical protein
VIPAQYRKQPGTIGNTEILTFHGYRVGCCSFTLTVDRSAMEGFGEICKYACVCGWHGNNEPESRCISKETWGYWGGEPAEYANECPACGGEECGENEDPTLSMKVTNRYTIHINPTHRRAA